MSFAVTWDPAALHVFYRLPVHSATLLDRAVIRFAESGTGHIERDPPYYRLRGGLYDAMLSVDRDARQIAVIRIYRAR